MRNWFSSVSGWAQDVTVRQGGEEKHARAFIQPLSVTSPRENAAATPAGVSDERLYLLIIGPDAVSGPGGEIVSGGRVYQVLRCEEMGGGSHWEGLLRLKGGAGDA